MSTSRRKFVTSITLGVGATAFPNFIENFNNLEPVNLNTNINSNELSSWFDKIKGEQRVVYDGSQPHNTLPIVWNWAFLESNNSVGVTDYNITAITVLRHSGIVFAFKSEIWEKFKLGELVSFNDNKTGKPALRNTVLWVSVSSPVPQYSSLRTDVPAIIYLPVSASVLFTLALHQVSISAMVVEPPIPALVLKSKS